MRPASSTDDIATIQVKAKQHVRIIFHHPSIVKIKSTFLEGDYKDRRMMYCKTMQEIEERKAELSRIIEKLLRPISV